MAMLFAREGATVAVADLEEQAARETADLIAAEGATAVTVVADASDERQSAAMFQDAADRLGGLDGVVLNVGIAAGVRLKGTSAADWDRVMAVSLRSHFLGCKHGLEHMDAGAIVLIGSLAAREVMPVPAYAASKLALESLGRQAAVEGAPDIRVNVVHPGLIDTALGRFASQQNPRRTQARIPARRQGTAWEVAYAALFLLSDEASYITGQALLVDGGLSIGPRG